MVLKIFKYKKVSSTNNVAILKIKQGYKTGVIISDTQTNGRGQYGKKWISNKGNLFFSMFFAIDKKSAVSAAITNLFVIFFNLSVIAKVLAPDPLMITTSASG